MFYKVTIDLSFPTKGQAVGLFNHAQGLLDQAVVINPGQPYEERGFIEIHRCFHDEDPSISCEVISHETPTL